jgi:hypothetical protein
LSEAGRAHRMADMPIAAHLDDLLGKVGQP